MNTLFETIFEQSREPTGIATQTGVLVAVNGAWERELGWTRAEVLGKRPRDLNLWAHDDQRDRAFAAMAAGRDFDEPVTIRRRDGTEFEAELAIRGIEHEGQRYVWSRIRDTSELVLSEARLRVLTMATFEGLALSEGGKIVDCNERLAEIFGYTPEELRGFPIAELSAPETRERVQAAVTTGHEMPYHHVGLRKDGTTMPIEVRARMVRRNDRWIRLSAVRDLTDQLRSAHELERRNAEMEQFVYTVSHDLKSPIITIKGFVGAIAGDLASGRTGTVAKDLERIARATDRMTALLDDLLEFSRIGRVAAINESVALGEIARDALELLAGPIGTRGAVIELEPLPTMRCDRGRILQVFQNLVENAVKYARDGAPPRIVIGAREVTRSRATIFVRDDGKGIAVEHHARVFGLFDKLDPRSEGTGVGLALVRRIIDVHGGRVWVESEGVGRGATFLFDIPLEPPTAP